MTSNMSSEVALPAWGTRWRISPAPRPDSERRALTATGGPAQLTERRPASVPGHVDGEEMEACRTATLDLLDPLVWLAVAGRRAVAAHHGSLRSARGAVDDETVRSPSGRRGTPMRLRARRRAAARAARAAASVRRTFDAGSGISASTWRRTARRGEQEMTVTTTSSARAARRGVHAVRARRGATAGGEPAGCGTTTGRGGAFLCASGGRRVHRRPPSDAGATARRGRGRVPDGSGSSAAPALPLHAAEGYPLAPGQERTIGCSSDDPVAAARSPLRPTHDHDARPSPVRPRDPAFMTTRRFRQRHRQPPCRLSATSRGEPEYPARRRPSADPVR